MISLAFYIYIYIFLDKGYVNYFSLNVSGNTSKSIFLQSYLFLHSHTILNYPIVRREYHPDNVKFISVPIISTFLFYDILAQKFELFETLTVIDEASADNSR